MAMATLNSKKILEEMNGRDASSVSSLTLTHRALSHVSCLAEFKNLERLDLCSNELTSVEGLKSCVNLKWLSVVQNKIESLEGIQGLTKLTVLNAGKNKLKSMAGVGYLISLRALILNDNEIISICKLDQIKELNTLVLSRNPVTEIGESLAKAKSMTKLSLSNCRLQAIGSSLTSCTDLKELRLAHNEIKGLPVELSRNARLLNLDLGNNWVRNMSDLKVLSSLLHLRNLNLQGNPIAEKDSLVKKIKKLLPNLQIFNSRPTDNFARKDNDRADRCLTVADSEMDQNKELGTPSLLGKKNSKTKIISDGEDDDTLNADRHGTREKSEPTIAKESHSGEKKRKKKLKSDSKVDDIVDDSKTASLDSDVEQDSKLKRRKKEKLRATNTASAQEQEQEKESPISRENDRKSKKKLRQNAANVIDDTEVPFAELFPADSQDNDVDTEQKTASNGVEGVDFAGVSVTIPKKNKKMSWASITDLSQVDEVGLGGPSTWDE